MKSHRIAVVIFLTLLAALGLSLSSRPALSQQGGFNIDTGVHLGAQKIKLAVPDFPPTSVDQQLVSLTQEFNQVALERSFWVRHLRNGQ